MRSRAVTITAVMIALLFLQALRPAGALAQTTICAPPFCGPASDSLLIKSTDVFGNVSVDVNSTFIEGSSVGAEVLTGSETINDSFQPGIPSGFDGGFRTAFGPSSITVGLTDLSSTGQVVVSDLLTATVDPASINEIPPGSMSNLCTPPEFCFVKINWTLTSDDESPGGLAAPAGIPLVPELAAGNELASLFQFQFTYQGGSQPGPFSIGPSSVMVTSDVETVTPPTPEPSSLLLLGTGLVGLLGAARRKWFARESTTTNC